MLLTFYFILSRIKNEIVAEGNQCHPELVSGSKKEMLKQVQHDIVGVQHDK